MIEIFKSPAVQKKDRKKNTPMSTTQIAIGYVLKFEIQYLFLE